MSRRVRFHDLLGLDVRDHDGHVVGTVHELKAERRGNALCVTGLLVGDTAWLTRIGWADREHGHEIPWERVEAVGSEILLRSE